MRPLRPKSSVRGWQAPRAQAVVHARLQAALVDTIQQGAGDVELGPICSVLTPRSVIIHRFGVTAPTGGGGCPTARGRGQTHLTGYG